MGLIEAISSLFSAIADYYNNLSALVKVIIIGVFLLLFILLILMLFGRGNSVYIVEGKRRHSIESESNEDVKEAYKKRQEKENERKKETKK